MRRHVKAQAKLTAAKAIALIPKKGMFVQGYWDELGSGVRSVLVLGVGPQFITLFYTPSLFKFKITHDRWALIHPSVYEPSLFFLQDSICAHVEVFTNLNVRFSKSGAIAALTIIQAKIGESNGAKPTCDRGASAVVSHVSNPVNSAANEPSQSSVSVDNIGDQHTAIRGTNIKSVSSRKVKRLSRKAKAKKHIS